MTRIQQPAKVGDRSTACNGNGQRLQHLTMRVPFNDLRRRHSGSADKILRSFGDFIAQGLFIGGPLLESFEFSFAKYCGVPACVGVANGTDALELALRAGGVKRKDEVITVANAGGYSTTACHALGACPVYADVDPITCQIDAVSLERAVTSRTKAIVVTHLYGFMNDVMAIRERLDALGRRDILLIEDCAQAHGARLHGARAGSIGDLGTFSFYPTKNLGGLGDGGAVTCRSDDLAIRVRELRQYGWRSKYEVVSPGGRNSRLDPLQAIILERQLPSLDAQNEKRNRICRIYRKNLPPGWQIVYGPEDRFVAHLAVVLAPTERHRNRGRQALSLKGIGNDIHYPVLDCDQPGWKGLGCASGNLTTSRTLTRRVLSLPCFPELADDEIEQVVDAFQAFE